MGYLNTSQINKLLREPIISIITTLQSDGTPHMTPVWHLFRKNKIIVAVEEKSVKARNVRKNTVVALCVAANEKPQRWALVNGKATVTKTCVNQIVKTMARHYIPGAEGDTYAKKVLAELSFVMLEITPTGIVGFDGSE